MVDINKKCKFVGLSNRIFADFDNERPYDENIVGISKYDEIKNFSGVLITLRKGDFIYLFMSVSEDPSDYVVSEGFVIENPYEKMPYKWCCRIIGVIQYIEDYKLNNTPN